MSGKSLTWMKALGQMLGVNQPTKRPSKSAKIFFLMNALDFLRPHRRPTLKGSRETVTKITVHKVSVMHNIENTLNPLNDGLY